jgi:hypothetical protein
MRASNDPGSTWTMRAFDHRPQEDLLRGFEPGPFFRNQTAAESIQVNVHRGVTAISHWLPSAIFGVSLASRCVRPAARGTAGHRMTGNSAPISPSRRAGSSDSSRRLRFQTGSPRVRATLGSFSGRSPVDSDSSLHQNSCCAFHRWLCFFTFFSALLIVLFGAGVISGEQGQSARRHLHDFRHI